MKEFKKFLWNIIVYLGVFALGVIMTILGVSVVMVAYESKPPSAISSMIGFIIMFIGLAILYSSEKIK